MHLPDIRTVNCGGVGRVIPRRLPFGRAWLLLVAISLSVAGCTSTKSPRAATTRDARALSRQVEKIDPEKPADFTQLSWVEAFAACHHQLATQYAFTAWKGIDWEALRQRYAPRIAAAQAAHDQTAYYLAIREYLFQIPDGHIGLEGDDRAIMKSQVGGGVGVAVVQLDDGRAIAQVVLEDGPAAQAGMKAGAEILTWSGQPVAAAARATSTLWTGSPTATLAHRERARWAFLSRGPAGAAVEVGFRNPGEENRQAVLTAVDDEGATLTRSGAVPKRFTPDRLVEHRILASGIGYIEIRAELEGAFDQFKAALESMTTRRVPALILDIRNNIGGEDQMAADIASFFHHRKHHYEFVQVYNPASGTFDILTDETAYLEPHRPRFLGPVIALIGPHTGSSGEGIALEISRAPRGRTLGFDGTGGFFGMSGGEIHLPTNLTVRFPFGASLDENGRVQVDSDHTGVGGVPPQIKLARTYENVLAVGRGEDVELQAAERELTASLAK